MLSAPLEVSKIKTTLFHCTQGGGGGTYWETSHPWFGHYTTTIMHYVVVTCLRAFQHLCANMAIRECLNSKDDYQTAKTTTVIMRSEASRQQNNNNSLSSSSTDKQLERPSNHLKEDSCKCSGCALVWFAISRSVGPSATTTECFSWSGMNRFFPWTVSGKLLPTKKNVSIFGLERFDYANKQQKFYQQS